MICRWIFQLFSYNHSDAEKKSHVVNQLLRFIVTIHERFDK
jgi:hypothetical protein